MPHPQPSLYIATTEIPKNEGMFDGLFSTISRGVAFAMGSSPAPKLDPIAPKLDPCLDHMAILHECLEDESSDCQRAFDDLVRCRHKFLPDRKAAPTQFFTR